MITNDQTEDQLLAINAVKKDMESHKIMDRLICVDLCKGKTEIAIRAAFRQYRKISRWSIWYRPLFWHSNITIHFARE